MNHPTLYPSPFQAGDRFSFKNKHGSVTLEALNAPRPVREIYLRDLPNEHRITWDDIEKIALITDQVRIQLIPGRDLKSASCGVIRHDTTHSAAFCRVVELSYTTATPAREQIQYDLDHGRNRDIHVSNPLQ